MWQDLFAALSLVLVIEGMLPFVKPAAWRRTIGRIADQSDNTLQLIGLISMLVGIALLYAVRQST